MNLVKLGLNTESPLPVVAVIHSDQYGFFINKC